MARAAFRFGREHRPARAPEPRRRARRGVPHEVRIIGGNWKRSKLPVADPPGLRPTPDRVRETLFNWLGQDLTGWRCLDAFAGSGALGFEAASRGAAEVRAARARAALVRQPAPTSRQRLNADAVRVERADAMAWMARCAGAASIWSSSIRRSTPTLFEPALAAARALVRAAGLRLPRGRRHARRRSLAALGLTLHRQGRAGAVHFHLLQQSARR